MRRGVIRRADRRTALTDRLGLFGELAWNQRHAQSEVWDLTDYSARLNLDYLLRQSGGMIAWPGVLRKLDRLDPSYRT